MYVLDIYICTPVSVNYYVQFRGNLTSDKVAGRLVTKEKHRTTVLFGICPLNTYTLTRIHKHTHTHTQTYALQ